MPDLPRAEVLAFDIGGTHLRAGLYSTGARRMTRVLRAPTPSIASMRNAGADRILESLLSEMRRLADELSPRPSVVSIAFAGPIDPDGRALAAPTIFGDALPGPLPLLDALTGLWPDARVFLLNDVTAAGHFYLRHPADDLCVVTVSSGIGHKVFVEGRPVVGPSGRGGELGHLRVDSSPEAPRCDCGERGHLGALASGRAAKHHVERRAAADPAGFDASALGRRIDRRLERYSNQALVEAFREGDAWSRGVIRSMAEPLGQVLAAVHLAVGVERFVVVGGFALALGYEYLRALADAARSSCWDRGAEWPKMLELGSDEEEAGLIGAGAFAARETESARAPAEEGAAGNETPPE